MNSGRGAINLGGYHWGENPIKSLLNDSVAGSALNNHAHDLREEQGSVASWDDAGRAVHEILCLQRHGRAKQLAVLDAERTLASAELSLAQFRASTSADQIAIFLALGGGWQEPGASTVAQK